MSDASVEDNKTGGYQKKKYPVILLITILLFLLITISLVVFLQIRIRLFEEAEKKETTRMIKTAQTFERQQDDVILRGGFDRIDKQELFIWMDISMKMDPVKVTLEEDTLFGCIPQYYQDRTGRTINRRMVYVNMDDYPLPNPGLEKSYMNKGREWFEKNIIRGEVTEAWFMEKDGQKVPYAVFTIIEDCR